MQRSQKIKGLVVRTVDVGESGRMLTVLTGELGKLSVYGGGIRSIKSHRLNSTQLFCYSEMTLQARSDRYYLGEVTPIEDFYALREDIVRLSLAQYVVDAVSTLTVEGEDQSKILRLTLNTLYLLASGKKSYDLIKGAFELRLASLLGFMPDLSGCSRCGKEEALFLIPEDGTLICSDCFMKLSESIPSPPVLLPLSPATLYAMRYVLSAPERRIFAFSLEPDEQATFANACEKYLLYHIERGFDTLEFYKQMAK
ncbi:MAG: DNA repair protein RecO [Eubacteriales bacterium]